MARPSLRRTLKLETLETRQVLSTVVGPTPDQQYALDLINLVRTDPSAAATMITSNITPDVQDTLQHFGLTASGLISEMDAATPQPPLAWSDALAQTAQAQSQYQANNGVQTHQGPGEASLSDRLTAAGYTNVSSFGENTYAYADSIDEAMQSFLFDWGVSDHGHYDNLMQPGTSAENAYKDVGIGLVQTSNQGLGPVVVTQDFGSQNNEGPQIIGVVYQDPNNIGFYQPGEGQANVTISVTNNSTGQNYQTQTFSSGGFQLTVAPNASYTVTATINGQQISSQQVQVSDVNVETSDFIYNPAKTTPVQPVATPTTTLTTTPAPSPTPTPAPTPTPTTSQSSQESQTQTNVQTPATSPTQPNQSSTSSSDASSQTSSSTSSDGSSLNVSGWSHWTAQQS